MLANWQTSNYKNRLSYPIKRPIFIYLFIYYEIVHSGKHVHLGLCRPVDIGTAALSRRHTCTAQNSAFYPPLRTHFRNFHSAFYFTHYALRISAFYQQPTNSTHVRVNHTQRLMTLLPHIQCSVNGNDKPLQTSSGMSSCDISSRLDCWSAYNALLKPKEITVTQW